MGIDTKQKMHIDIIMLAADVQNPFINRFLDWLALGQKLHNEMSNFPKVWLNSDIQVALLIVPHFATSGGVVVIP